MKRFLALWLMLCLLCPVALAENNGQDNDLAEFVELYQMYQSALASGMEISFEEFCDFYLMYQSKAAGAQGTEPAATEEPEAVVVEFTDSSTYLPDPHYFFHEKLRHGEMDIAGGHMVYFQFHRDSAEAAKEYIELLFKDNRFNLELRTIGEKNSYGCIYTYYVFDYKGELIVDDIAVEGNNGVMYVAPIIIYTIDRPEDYAYFPNKYEIRVSYSSNFSFVETEDRSNIKTFIDKGSDSLMLGPVDSFVNNTSNFDSSNKSSSSASSSRQVSNSSSEKRKCTTCNGTGWRTCLTCGGKGTIDKLVTNVTGGSQWEHKVCPNFNCVGGSVKCTMCSGTGWR